MTQSTKESLEELEAAKEELETRLANEQLPKPPKVSAEFMTFWLHRFRKLDVTKQSHRKMLIDTFINAIYLYDDKMLITFTTRTGRRKSLSARYRKPPNGMLLVRIWNAHRHQYGDIVHR